METLEAGLTAAFVIAGAFLGIKIFEILAKNDYVKAENESREFRTWSNDRLVERHNELVGLISSGKRKPEYFRHLESIRRILDTR
jgi:hypothetical protein